GAAYGASATSAPRSRNDNTFTPRTGDVEPETSSEMIPYSSSACCGPDGTSALLSRVRPLHSLQHLESEHTSARELLEQGPLAGDCPARRLPSELAPRAPRDLYLLLPRQLGLVVRLGGRLRARLGPILYLDLHQAGLTHHLLPFDQQVWA